MRYTVRVSVVQVLGRIWMPSADAAMAYTLTTHDVDNVRLYGSGKITRQSVEGWLNTHAGDFASITDFSASIESGEDTIDIPWRDEDNMLTYSDLTSPGNE
jgi:hypothetical protein